MLAAALLLGVVALVATTPLLFTALARRGVSAFAGVVVAVAAAAASAVAVAAAGVVPRYAAVAAAVLAVVSVAWLPVTRRWGALGRVAWGAAVYAGGAYLAYVLALTFRTDLGPLGTAGALVLWLLEAAAYAFGLTYLWEMVDVLATGRWRRRSAGGPVVPDARLPFVSLHVPAHNEPPDMVIETLTSLLALDYPAYEVVMIDDNTSDPALWRPVEEFCAAHPDVLRFFHLEDWPGFKSGALNFALTVTDPRAEVIGVVDADYVVEPDYLRRCAAFFAEEPGLAFVQTPQDYREWKQSSYYRRLYYSYAYFFAVSQASRNERDGAIFGGTMGLIRRSALTQVGGWDEWCITEDAELSLRLLRAGWSGRHVDRSFGHGVMPLTFDALKRQRFRWCFGGIQILRMHWRSLLPWDRDPANRLTLAQRWAYLCGGLQWFGDVLGLAFTAVLSIGLVNMAFGSGIVFRRLSGFLLAAVPALALLAAGRAVALVRRSTGATWRDALGAFGIWLALGWTVANASVRGLFAPAGVFLRTPKTRGDASVRDAVRANRAETAIAAFLLVAAALAAWRVAGPLRWSALALAALPLAGALAAPWNTVAALRAELPDDLRRRRRTERLRAWTNRPVRARHVVGAGALSTAAAGVAAVFLFTSSPLPGAVPDVLAEARGGPRRSPDGNGDGAGVRVTPTRAPVSTPSATVRTPGAPVSGAPAAPGTAATSPPAAGVVPAPATTGAPGAPASSPSGAAGRPTSGPGATAAPTAPANQAPTARPTAAPTAAPTGAAPTARPTTRPTSNPAPGAPSPSPSRRG